MEKRLDTEAYGSPMRSIHWNLCTDSCETPLEQNELNFMLEADVSIELSKLGDYFRNCDFYECPFPCLHGINNTGF